MSFRNPISFRLSHYTALISFTLLLLNGCKVPTTNTDPGSKGDGKALVNQPPTAQGQTIVTTFNAEASIVLSGSDGDNDPLTFKIVTEPSHGNLNGTAPNLSYVPTAGYVGEDEFTFSVNDGTNADSSPARISLTVSAAAPSLSYASSTGTTGTVNSAMSVARFT